MARPYFLTPPLLKPPMRRHTDLLQMHSWKPLLALLLSHYMQNIIPTANLIHSKPRLVWKFSKPPTEGELWKHSPPSFLYLVLKIQHGLGITD